MRYAKMHERLSFDKLHIAIGSMEIQVDCLLVSLLR